jgi:ornithine--oxo-acid transaminase
MSIAQVERHGAHNYHPLPVVITRAEGPWVWDESGRRYLDMLSSYSALNQGHRHPRIVEAMRTQLERVTLTSRAFHNDQLGPFLERLSEVSGFTKALPMNTGAEAVETGIKAVRKWGHRVKGVPDGRQRIIVAENNFHGRTTTIISFSTEAQYRDGFGPLTPGFDAVPFGDAAAVEAAITPDTVAVLVEPIQGEAGVVMPPAGYLRDLRAICDRHDVLLFLDEIQTGLGRTGKMWAFQHEGIRPDCIAVGKALGGGLYPVSAFCADDRIMDVFTPGDHGSTFGGNPLGAAVARAALDVLVDENLAARAAEVGGYLMGRLEEMRSPHVKEVRGSGLLIGVELHVASGAARPYCEALMERGVLCKDTHGQVIRFAPPLVIGRDVVDDAMEQVQAVLA